MSEDSNGRWITVRGHHVFVNYASPKLKIGGKELRLKNTPEANSSPNTNKPTSMKDAIELSLLAQDLISKAKVHDEETTNVLKTVASMGNGTLEGLQFRIKGKASLERKLVEKAGEKGLTVREYAKRVTDVLRYTQVSDPDNLAEDCLLAMDNLRKMGYSTVEATNTLKDTNAVYRGINTLVRAPDGYVFELQYHTPQSLEIKEINHKLYEEQRLASTSIARKLVLKDQMLRNAKKVERPKEIDKIADI